MRTTFGRWPDDKLEAQYWCEQIVTRVIDSLSEATVDYRQTQVSVKESG